MGGIIEINSTLQITREQGFPKELDHKKHLAKPFKAEDFKDKIFEFKNKSGIRVFSSSQVQVFLVENINGKWLYWGLIHILEIHHDYINKTTSGKFKIIYIYPPEKMKDAYNLIDRDKEKSFIKK